MRQWLEVYTLIFILVIVLSFGALLTGCAGFTSSLVVTAVDDYCTLPEGDRSAYRSLINSRVRPNSVRIECNWGGYE